MNYLTDQELEVLIREIKSGNNDAWEKIYHNFEGYIHKCCQDKLIKLCLSDEGRRQFKDDLYMAGWQGFVNAMKNYNPEKGKFLTYATYNIKGEISKELNSLLNPLGLTDRPISKKKRESGEAEGAFISRVSIDDEAGISENALSYALLRNKHNDSAESEISGDDDFNLMLEIAGLLKVEKDSKEQLEQLFSEGGISDLGGYSDAKTEFIRECASDESGSISVPEIAGYIKSEFDKIFERYGLRYDFGFSWSLTCYPR